MLFRKQHLGYVNALGDNLHDVEHFRIHPDSPVGFNTNSRLNQNAPQNIAVVVLKSGACFVGHSLCSRSDQYNHKIGYDQSLLRALRRARWADGGRHGEPGYEPDFMVDNELVGRDLRHACSEAILGVRF